MVGFKHMAAVYFASGFGGNLFSACLTINPSVGASTSDFGILTGLLAMVFVNWSAFNTQQLQQVRCMLVAMVVIMILLNFMMSFTAQGTIDTYGHLGGAIAGLIWGMAFFPRNRTPGAIKMK
jgi:rhomboid protease GluP